MATLTLTATISILCFIIENALTCGGGGGGGGKGGKKEKPVHVAVANKSMFTGNLSDPKKWSDHWKPTKGLTVKDYSNWMADYKKKQEMKDKEALEAAGGGWPEKPDDAGVDWPEHWKGLGPGSGGVPPPPWAYVKESSGKADLCFLAPNRGPCQEYVARWGFNPYIDDCAQFVYGGCEGNANNFWSKRRCREACVGIPSGNCVSGSNLILETFNFDDIPEDVNSPNSTENTDEASQDST